MNQTPRLLIQLRKALTGKTNFPIGTLVYFGPDDATVTKVVAVVVPSREADPILNSWEGTGIVTQASTASEIGQFFKLNKVKDVVMAGGIVGCPHDEGIDFPVGEDCPYCPFWGGDQN